MVYAEERIAGCAQTASNDDGIVGVEHDPRPGDCRSREMMAGEDAEARARKAILEFLELDSPEEMEFTDDVRIVLVSGDFSSELATSVMRLNKHDLDVTCIRLKPYKGTSS
jgi:hypothetical protein